jgi:AGZA family xanthine/uracil permease-like MFS transporter
MGIVARYPVALAPGMGENFFFVSVIMSLSALGFEEAWKVALGVVFVAGVVFLILSVLPVRRMILDAISPSMRGSIAVGIGMFIAFIGLRNGGLVVDSPGTLVSLNADLLSADVAVFAMGLIVTGVLRARGITGAILFGILASLALAGALGEVSFGGVVGLPEIAEHAAFELDVAGALSIACLPFIVVFVVMDLLDTTGTLVAVAEQGGFLRQGKMPRAGRAMLVDASATVGGALLGTSTVTSYIESCAGIAAGGRTGLASVVTGVLFFAALLFSPAIGAVAEYPPVTAPALVTVGALMMASARAVQWDDVTEALPALLVMLGIPLTYSIADGLALGFAAYPVVKLLSGRGREVHAVLYVLALVLIAYFLLVRADLA